MRFPDQIADRLHVSAGPRAVIRAVRRAIKRKHRAARDLRAARHQAYRRALAKHAANVAEYVYVMGGLRSADARRYRAALRACR